MKNYKFLLRPLFFICSLLFSCWIVLLIEKVSPSDFGKYRSLFENNQQPDLVMETTPADTTKYAEPSKRN